MGCGLLFISILVNSIVFIPLQQELRYEKITIPCINLFQKKKKLLILRDKDELENLFAEFGLAHPSCSIKDLPTIDFEQYTLVGYYVTTEGCQEPRIEFNIVQNHEGIIIKSIAIQEGICRVARITNSWFLISKISPSVKVTIEEN